MHQGQSRHLGAQTRSADTLSPAARGSGARRQHETKVDSEAGMLSGVSRKRSIRSNPCWFTEFCKSQCLSHFAAPFIVVRAETSIAESCKLLVAGAIGNPQRQHACEEALAAGTKRNRQSDGPIRPTTHEHLHKGPHKGKSSHTSSQEDAGEYVWNMCE